MVQREGYYDYMLRRSREEDSRDSRGRIDILEHTIQEMQKEIHALQMSVKRLSDENYRLKENANIHNN
jgi:predicted RNase H-like nuclease (RuvC/YqgF family)